MDESQRWNLELAYVSLRLKGWTFGEAELTRELLSLDRFFSDASLPSIVMDSKRIEFEQTSKRFVVTFCANGSTKEETIRSGSHGRQARCDSAEHMDPGPHRPSRRPVPAQRAVV